MPFTINGCGTHYYFKRNVVTKQGVCESCRRTAVLTDYDIGYFLVAFYIPILPLGRQMIIGECNACGQHRSMSLRLWETLREQSIDAGLTALAQEPQSGPAALRLLMTYTTFNQLEDAWNLAQAMMVTHAQNYDVLLALGGWFESLEHSSAADNCYRAAMLLDPNRPESKRIRIFQAMEAKAYSEIKSLALDLLGDRTGNHNGVVFRAAQYLAERQKFDESFLLYEKMVAHSPDLIKDKDFRRAARIAEQGVGRPAALVPAKKLGVLD